MAAPTVTGVSPAAGPLAGGTAVTITGTGFTGATAVDFGMTRGNQRGRRLGDADHGHQPGGAAGTVNVTVVTPGGTSATSSTDHFSYVAAPTVTGVSPAAGPLAGGTSVTITGTGFTGATAVDFGTTAATSVVVSLGHADHGQEPGGHGYGERDGGYAGRHVRHFVER